MHTCHKLFLLLFVGIGFNGYLVGQEKVFPSATELYAGVKKAIQDSTSPFYYPRLLDKLSENQNSLTNDEYFHLFYGKIYQPFFHTYRLSNASFKRLINSGKTKKAMAEGNRLLEEDPTNLEVLVLLSRLQASSGKNTEMTFLDGRIKGILECILLTGNGKTENTAFQIPMVEDQYVVKGVMNFSGGTRSTVMSQDTMIDKWMKGKDEIYFCILVKLPENFK